MLATQTIPQTPAEDDGGHRRRRPAGGVRRQGRDPRDHQPDRHRRRRRPRDRVPRVRDPRAVDGRSHDDLQHVDRGRRPRGDGRSRRHDVRLPGGQAARAVGRRLGAGPRRLALAPHRRRRDVRRGGHDRRHRPPAARLVGHEPGPVGHDRRRRSRARLLRRRGEARRRPPRSGVHGARAGDADPRDPAGHRLHRLVHELTDRGPPPGGRRRRADAAWPRDSVRWWCPARSP